jgi:hypothetical protein
VEEAVAEVPIGQDGKLFARLDEIGDRGFHAAGARSGDGDIEFVGRGKGVAEEATDVFGDLEEIRIQVPDDGLVQRLVDARRHHAGSRSQQQARGRAQRGKRFGYHKDSVSMPACRLVQRPRNNCTVPVPGVAQTIVVCRLRTGLEHGRPRKTMACPTANLLYSYFLDTALA